ncbi:MAG: tRNA pseudouridine(55) synthase TruB [Alphaproteobacteria bacterium]
MSVNGWLVVDKPLGPSSAQVVGKVKWLFKNAGMKLTKIGHAGTLDPLASGLLPLALGEATKTVGFMLEADKAYEFTVVFGTQTSTDDAAGDVVAESPVRPTLEEVMGVLGRFTGPITQMPPAVSALKVAGERAYDVVRRGEVPVLQAREVVVRELRVEHAGEAGGIALDARLRGHDAPKVRAEQLRCFARVSKGTYIRSLARDMAVAVGTVGHVGSLRRVVHGPFDSAEAITLEELDRCLKTGQTPPVRPVVRALHGLAAYQVSPAQAHNLHHGKALADTGWKLGVASVMEGERLVAMVEVDSAGTAHPKRVFNL